MRSKPRITKRYMSAWGALVGDGEAPKPRKKRSKPSGSKIETESQAQIKLCTWMDKNNILFFHPANGGYRNPIEAAKFKRSGVKSGVPDLCIPQARKGYHGLWIELKRIGLTMSRLSEEQWWWGKRLAEEGYFWKVAFGFDHGKSAVMDYFGMEE